MFSDELFRPYHVVPPSEFIAAALKFSHDTVAHALVKLHAVHGEILVIIGGRTAYAGVEIGDVLSEGDAFQLII